MNNLPYGICVGNWGDVICSLGYCKQAMEHGNMIYYGHIQEMPEFLSAQPFINDVKLISPTQSTTKVMSMLWNPETYDNAVDIILSGSDITKDLISNTAIRFWDSDIPIAKDLILPQYVHDQVSDLVSHLPRPFYVIQPFSINTNSINQHYPFWSQFIFWICQDKSKHFVLAGTGWDDSPYAKLSNVTSIVNKTPSAMNVFALAEKSSGVITTSNSLAHWCVSQNLKTMVLPASRSSEPDYFFTKVIKSSNVHLFTYYSKLIKVSYAAKEIFDIWPTEFSAEPSHYE